MRGVHGQEEPGRGGQPCGAHQHSAGPAAENPVEARVRQRQPRRKVALDQRTEGCGGFV